MIMRSCGRILLLIFIKSTAGIFRKNPVKAFTKIRYMFWSVVFIIIGLFVGLMILLAIFQSRFIYFPSRDIAITPDSVGLSYWDISFKSLDGNELSAWFIPAENPRGVVLFCHGNAGNISHRLDSIQIFYNLNLSTFIFDYRGYGKSNGKPTEKGTYLDAESAWQHLIEKQKINPEDIILFGRSLGGTIASWLAKQHTPKALIIESTFTSIPDMAAKLYPFLPVKLLARFKYNALDYIQQAHCPVLIIHSRNDEMIPFSHGQRLFQKANEPKQLLEIQGTHNEGFLISEKFYINGLDSFISKYTGK